MSMRVTTITSILGEIVDSSSGIYPETLSIIPLETGRSLRIHTTGGKSELLISNGPRNGVFDHGFIDKDNHPVRLHDSIAFGLGGQVDVKVTRLSPFKEKS